MVSEYGILCRMGELRKITLNLPAELIDGVMADSEKGLTETIREALETMRSAAAWKRLKKLRGTADFGMSWQDARGKFDDE